MKWTSLLQKQRQQMTAHTGNEVIWVGSKKKRRKKRTKEKKKPEVTVVGPPTQELVERIRVILEKELWHRKKRALENPRPDKIWLAERVENALLALDELERRAEE